MPETSLANTIEAAEKIRHVLEEHQHAFAGKVTAGFGAAERMKFEMLESWYKRLLDELCIMRKREVALVVAAAIL